jgi:hypothetical protein
MTVYNLRKTLATRLYELNSTAYVEHANALGNSPKVFIDNYAHGNDEVKRIINKQMKDGFN